MLKLNALPDWYTPHVSFEDEYVANVDQAYPEILRELQAFGQRDNLPSDVVRPPANLVTSEGLPGPDLNQYWLEVAYRIIKWNIFMSTKMSGLGTVKRQHFKHSEGGKSLWAQKSHPKGRIDVNATDPDQGWKQIGREAAVIWQALTGLPVPAA